MIPTTMTSKDALNSPLRVYMNVSLIRSLRGVPSDGPRRDGFVVETARNKSNGVQRQVSFVELISLPSSEPVAAQ